MKIAFGGLCLALLLALPARAQTESLPPRVCPTQLSTPVVDLGHYRGAYLVTNGDGSRLGQEDWHACPPAPVGGGRENAWESCNFSMCNLPEGNYAVRVTDAPGKPLFTFHTHKGFVFLDPGGLVFPAGNYGVDATGAMRPFTLDLQGYALDWHIAHWPAAFTGRDTHGRATHDGQTLKFMLFAGQDYSISFAGAQAHVTLDAQGNPQLTPGGPLTVRNGAAALRGTAVAVAAPAGAGWSANGIDFTGPQTLIVPPGAAITLRAGNAEQRMTLDAACGVHISPGALAASAQGTCPP